MSARTDFPDWISPMLVKELRQGLRSKAFLISFLLLQAAMILLTFSALLMAAQGVSTASASALFWVAIGLPVLLIMPASGLNSISGEMRENTLELIFLSRLSARRIVFGKWLAVISQTLLLLSAILPYLVLRYYLGGVNIAGDLAGLGWMLLISALLAAFTIGLSPHTGRVARAFLPIGIILAVQFGSVFFLRPFFGPVAGAGLGTSGNVAIGCALAALGGLFLLCLLEFGAQKIAPAAENHSTLKRLAALAAILVCGVTVAFWPKADWIWVIGLVLLTPIAIGSIGEPVRLIPSLYRPFARRGWPGKLLARGLFPGWPAGVVFVFLILVVFTLIPNGPFENLRSMILQTGSETRERMWAFLTLINIFGFFFLPAALLQIPRARAFPPMVLFVIFQILCAILALIGRLAHSEYPGLESLVAMIPSTGLFLGAVTADWSVAELQPTLTGAGILTGAAMVFLFFKSLAAWPAIAALGKAGSDPAK